MSKPLILFLVLLFIPSIYNGYTALYSVHSISKCPIKHLAVIMDGNRRWARKRNLVTHKGHKKGAQTFETLLKFCLERQIEIVSVYTFSLENLKRKPEEVQYMFNLIMKQAEKKLPELVKQGVRVQIIGDIHIAPPKVQATIKRVQKETQHGKRLLLNILFCYGGRQEILSAIHHLIQDMKDGKIDGAPTEDSFKKYLWTSDIPDPDLIIRTGGEKRLSNFLTYQTCYSELYFTNRLWPDITMRDLAHAIDEYCNRERRLGT